MDEESPFRTVDLPIPLLTLERALIEQSRSDQARILNPNRLERSLHHVNALGFLPHVADHLSPAHSVIRRKRS
jgi:hypothetical protein